MSTRKIHMVILLCIVSMPAWAFADRISATITNLPVLNELPSNSVYTIYKDSEGFIWLGTNDGLCRYDGYRVKTWRSNRENMDLLTDNAITAIAEDNERTLFIGTKRGLNLMDSKRLTLRHSSASDLNDYEIRAVVPDADGASVWVGTYKRLVRASNTLDSVRTYDTSLPVTSVNTVYRDSKDGVWVSFWRSGLYRYNRRTDRFQKMNPIGAQDNPMRIVEYGDSYLVGTWGDGLYRLRKNPTGGYTPEKIVINVPDGRLDAIFGMTVDSFNHIWMISHSGLFCGELNGNTLELKDVSALSNETNNIFHRLMTDDRGCIWIAASDYGAYIINQTIPIITKTSLPLFNDQSRNINPTLSHVCCHKGKLWFNQPRCGLGYYDLRDGTTKMYREIPALSALSDLNETSFITQLDATNDTLYVGSQYFTKIHVLISGTDGVRLVDSYSFNSYDGAPRCMVRDSKYNLWIATDRHLIIRKADGRCHRIISNLADITSIIIDGNDSAWISSLSQGVIKVSVETKADTVNVTKRNIAGTAELSVISLVKDGQDDVLWAVGKYGHLVGVNSTDDSFTDFTGKVNLQLSRYVHNLFIDKENNKWISTGKMLYRFTPDFSTSVQYDAFDSRNKESSLNSDAVCYDASGNRLYYGCSGGFVTVDVDALLAEDSSPIAPVLSDVKISGLSVFDTCDGMVDFHNRMITLPSNAKDIRLEFSALRYSNQDRIRFSYRMKDLETDWTEFDSGSPVGFYNELPKGEHTLLIRATDENGQWGLVTSYTIDRLPAWYETWWAYLLYAFAALALLSVTYIYIRSRIREKQLMQQAQLDKKNTEALTEMKLKYFANISHDFLTPITIISCLIDDMETVYGISGNYLDKIRFNLAKVKGLIQQILDYRKVETGNMRLRVSVDNLSDYIDRICRNHFQPLMARKHINFSYDNDCEPIIGYFDSDKIEKVLFNLVSNAYKYTPDGGSVSVCLRSRKVGDVTYAVVKVSDTGIGIEKKDLEKIFDRFYTIGTSAKVGSNGIGLSLVKDLLEMHHGSISVESTSGKGSVFTIEFPVSKMEYSLAEIVENGSIIGSPLNQHAPADLDVLDQSDNKNETDVTLLLVEDNEELLSIMRKIFARSYHVLSAHNGVEALDAVEKNDIDLIVSDVMMPEMDGLELCRTLKSSIKTSHIPVILLTAKNRSEDRIECYNAGADGYIAKPFELPVLVARIDNFIRNKRDKQDSYKGTPEGNTSTLELSQLDQEFFDKLIALINEHIEDENFEIDTLASKVYMSRSSLYRKVKTITGMSPVELVRTTRLKRGYELLKEGQMNISQIAYATGFSTPRYFSTCFKEQFGISPRDVPKS